MMQAETKQVSYWYVFAATLITAFGWGLGWIISTFFTVSTYMNRYSPVGAINYFIGYSFIGITFTLLALRLIRTRLPLSHIIILYATMGISAIVIGLLMYRDQWGMSTDFVNFLPILMLVFGITISGLLTQSIPTLTWQNGLGIGLGWIAGLVLPFTLFFFTSDLWVSWMLFGTPIATYITFLVGGCVMFWYLRHAQQSEMMTSTDKSVAIGPRIKSTAQGTTFEVVYETGKPKAKRKSKPQGWMAIPHLRIYIAAFVISVLVIGGITTLIAPVREVRVPGFITPNPTNSTPGPQWGNKLPPIGPKWGWNTTALTNSPVGDIPANSQVRLEYRYYDFGAEMWWYKATSSDGNTGDAWEWQISPMVVSPPATTAATRISTLGPTSVPTLTPTITATPTITFVPTP